MLSFCVEAKEEEHMVVMMAEGGKVGERVVEECMVGLKDVAAVAATDMEVATAAATAATQARGRSRPAPTSDRPATCRRWHARPALAGSWRPRAAGTEQTK